MPARRAFGTSCQAKFPNRMRTYPAPHMGELSWRLTTMAQTLRTLDQVKETPMQGKRMGLD
ncbi:hypothetical protein D3C80_2204440 [compost metagenome]